MMKHSQHLLFLAICKGKLKKKGDGNGERNKSDDGVDNSDDYNNFDVDAGPSLLLTQYDDDDDDGDDDDCDDFDAAER